MRRLLVLLVLLGLPALAQGRDQLDIRATHSGEVWIRPSTGGDYVKVADQTPCLPTVEDPGVKYDVLVLGEHHRFLWRWTATRTGVWTGPNNFTMTSTLELDRQRLVGLQWGTVALVATIAGLLVLRARLRARRAVTEFESTQKYVRTLESRGGDPIRFGPYSVVRRLGQGGMAKVFEVEDQYGEHYALKTPTVDDEERRDDVLARFEREFKILSAFKHPGIVRIHDYRPDCEEHRAFLVMELIPGDTLDARLNMLGRLGIPQAVSIARQILQVLAYCHSHGIVHRDLTPGNVFLLPGGGVKIVDFGISKDLNLAMTRTGATLGTPFYSAPEQIEGKWATERTDLFAVGILLYQMLTGTIPHSDVKDVTKFYMRRAAGVEKTPQELNPVVSEALSSAVMRLLQVDPGHRPANAEAALALLE